MGEGDAVMTSPDYIAGLRAAEATWSPPPGMLRLTCAACHKPFSSARPEAEKCPDCRAGVPERKRAERERAKRRRVG